MLYTILNVSYLDVFQVELVARQLQMPQLSETIRSAHSYGKVTAQQVGQQLKPHDMLTIFTYHSMAMM